MLIESIKLPQERDLKGDLHRLNFGPSGNHHRERGSAPFTAAQTTMCGHLTLIRPTVPRKASVLPLWKRIADGGCDYKARQDI